MSTYDSYKPMCKIQNDFTELEYYFLSNESYFDFMDNKDYQPSINKQKRSHRRSNSFKKVILNAKSKLNHTINRIYQDDADFTDLHEQKTTR